MGATSRSDASIKIVNGDHNAAAGRRRKKKSWKEFRRKRLSISNPLWIVSKATSGADDRFLCSSYYILITILSLSLSFERGIYSRTFDESIRARLKNRIVAAAYESVAAKKKKKNAKKRSVFDICRKKFFPAGRDAERAYEVGGVGGGRWYLRGPNNPNKEQTARVMEKGRLIHTHVYTHRKKEKEK